MKNYRHDGKVMDYVAGGDVVSGGVVVLPGIGCGVAVTNGKNGEKVAVNIDGVFELPTDEQLAQGVRAFWSGTKVTASATGNTLMGMTMGAASGGLVEVKLIPLGDTEPGNLAQAAAVADIDTPDGSDEGTTKTLANDTKAKVNEILASLRAAGLMETSS